MASEPLPQRPYFVRALHEWMSDSGLTPHILVDASVEGVDVPEQYVENGKIVLNVSFSATDHLELGNDHISFAARFSGTSRPVLVPIAAVLGIYARESGQGMVFSEQDMLADASTDRDAHPDAGADKKFTGQAAKSESASPHPHLRIIK